MKFLFVLAGSAGLEQSVDARMPQIPVAPYAPPPTLAEAASLPVGFAISTANGLIMYQCPTDNRPNIGVSIRSIEPKAIGHFGL